MPVVPRPSPCPSCPYRKDCPSGLWAEHEYAKLPGYDKPTWEQPPTMFHCHTAPDLACAGWVACHDMTESLGLRMGISMGLVTDPDAFCDYTTEVALFSTGAEAAEHGMREIEYPSEEAGKAYRKIERQRARKPAKP